MMKKPHPADIHVGKMLRQQRCYVGLSQTALAGSVGITFQQLQKYESAANRVSASRLWDFAHVLGAPVEVFFPPLLPIERSVLWDDDPGFIQWARFYHETPEEGRELLLDIVRVLSKGRLFITPLRHV